MKFSTIILFMTLVVFGAPANSSIYLRHANVNTVDNVTQMSLKKRTEVDPSASINDCAICLKSIDPLECIDLHSNGHAHSFHKNCLKSWFEAQNNGGQYPSCPECRARVTVSEQEQVDPSMNINYDLILADASARGDIDLVRETAERASEEGLNNSLLKAASNGHIDVVEFLVPSYVSGLEFLVRSLFNAAMNDHHDVVQFLVPNHVSNQAEVQWALFIAAGSGCANVVETLVPYVSNKDILKYVMSNALENRHLDIVNFLENQINMQ